MKVFENNICVSFTFFQIFGTSWKHTTKLIIFAASISQVPSSDLGTSWPQKLQIFGKGKKECKYFQILKVHFHNELGLRPKRYFQVFFKPPQNLFTCQISKWSDTQFKFFANRYPILGKFVTKIFFLQNLNSCLTVRTGIFRFWSKMSKI